MTTPELVIFDCDGVLVDSEIVAARVSADLLKAAGVTITIEDLNERFSGMTFQNILVTLEQEQNVPLQVALIDQIEARVDARLQKELKAIDGAAQAVLSLPYKRCICSNSRPARIDLMLKRARLLPLFENLIFSAAGDVAMDPKPAPDVFLHAASSMGVDPARAIVIEDSVHGVAGACAAGMRVIGFTGASHTFPHHAEMLMDAGALTTINRMQDLKPTISALAAWSGDI